MKIEIVTKYFLFPLAVDLPGCTEYRERRFEDLGDDGRVKMVLPEIFYHIPSHILVLN